MLQKRRKVSTIEKSVQCSIANAIKSWFAILFVSLELCNRLQMSVRNLLDIKILNLTARSVATAVRQRLPWNLLQKSNFVQSLSAKNFGIAITKLQNQEVKPLCG